MRQGSCDIEKHDWRKLPQFAVQLNRVAATEKGNRLNYLALLNSSAPLIPLSAVILWPAIAFALQEETDCQDGYTHKQLCVTRSAMYNI